VGTAVTRLKTASALVLALGVLTMASQAVAGDYEKIGTTGGRYQFTDCARPEAPTLTLNRKKTGNAAILDYNVQVDRMNKHLERVQVYMTCLSAEADRDLQTYYNAVSASLLARQTAMDDEISALRRVLAKGPNRKNRQGRPVPGIPALRGADGPAKPPMPPDAPDVGPDPTPGQGDRPETEEPPDRGGAR